MIVVFYDLGNVIYFNFFYSVSCYGNNMKSCYGFLIAIFIRYMHVYNKHTIISHTSRFRLIPLN